MPCGFDCTSLRATSSARVSCASSALQCTGTTASLHLLKSPIMPRTCYDGEPYSNGVMSEGEREALRQVQRIMIEAMNATPNEMNVERFVATDWPQRIGRAAEEALRLMLRRGRFSEEAEESEPSRR
jgi:hypothetical protein